MKQEQIKSAEELLRGREARGLRVPAVIRIVFCLYGVGAFFTTDTPTTAVLITCGVAGAIITANLYFLKLLRDVRKVELVGRAGVAMDILGLTVYPFIVYHQLALESAPPALLSKTLLIAVCLTFMVINSLALRPIYPIVVTFASVIVHIVLLIVAVNDPRTAWASTDIDVLIGPATSVSLIVHQMIFLVIVGGTLALLTGGVRKVVLEAVELEAERFRTHREHAILLMEGKIGSLGKLVAGVSHEINTPLAVVKCNAEASGPAVSQLREGLERAVKTGQVDDRVERVLGAVEQNERNSLNAIKRIESTVETLRSFAHLDEAEFQRSDIHLNLDSTLALIPTRTIGSARLVKQYGEVPEIQCYAGRLNQVFMTLLTNAFEAIEGGGSVTISTWAEGDKLFVRFSDTGRGIPPDRLERLFDIDLRAKASRVAAGFGLAASHSIVNQHGGEIHVESAVGKGSTFTVMLPVTPTPVTS